jgi:conjugal transfer pilus assembly protein TraU
MYIPKRNLMAVLAGFLLVLCGLSAAHAQSTPAPTCRGRFMNPITDICWSCVLPIKIGGMAVQVNGQEDTSTSGGQPICACTGNGVPKIGVKVSFWEPARVVEVVRSPYCFPSLGGIKMDVGIDAPAHGRSLKKGNTKSSFYHAHWYINPLLFWLEVLIDNGCLEQNVFDLGYFTEVDPLWSDSELTFILNPDASLFTSIIAQAACAADCVAASAGFPLNEIFWCAGCQGSMYPLDGWVGAHVGGVQASSLLTQRMTNKMHREGLIWAASGDDGLCGFYPQPLMDKRNYKNQMVYPVRNTQKWNGKCCHPFGRTTTIWQSGKEIPYIGEDFAYQIFRKRDCCQGAISP